jgi:hypothetical protein
MFSHLKATFDWQFTQPSLKYSQSSNQIRTIEVLKVFNIAEAAELSSDKREKERRYHTQEQCPRTLAGVEYT